MPLDLPSTSDKAVFEARDLSLPACGYKIDSRSSKERRQNPDRREMIRFQEDRRSGQDRRPVTGWQRTLPR